jgi:hypothetical protein
MARTSDPAVSPLTDAASAHRTDPAAQPATRSFAALGALGAVLAAAALVFLGLGFRKVYFQPKAACADGYCARPASGRVIKAVLWGATILTLAGLGIELWAPLVL